MRHCSRPPRPEVTKSFHRGKARTPTAWCETATMSAASASTASTPCWCGKNASATTRAAPLADMVRRREAGTSGNGRPARRKPVDA